ncbi:MAG: hypothetical protein PHX89_09135 [bacterium]|jgi:biotin carboxyl carrier protein|nr:hypothetical protein [bacterium]
MDIEEIRKALAIMDNNDLNELFLQIGDMSLTLKRDLPVQEELPACVCEECPGVEVQSTEALSETSINAGMVGILHLTDKHGLPTVTVGGRVSKGQTVCAIEAMKIRHDIRSVHNGVVSEIVTQDGVPVEYGQPLMVIRQEDR